MIQRLKHELIFVTIVLAVVTVAPSSAQSNSNANVKVYAEQSEKDLDRYREILQTERKLLDEQSERYFSRIDNLLNRTLWVMGVIGAVSLGLFWFVFGKSRNDLRQFVNEQFEAEIANSVKSELAELKGSLEIEHNTITDSIRNLGVRVEELESYQNRQIVWIFPNIDPEYIEQRSQAVLEALGSRGFKNIRTVAPAKVADLDLGDPDIVIFSYDRTSEAQALLSTTISILGDMSPPISLLIYTYSPDGSDFSLDTNGLEIIRRYFWSVPVNFPATLVAQTQLLIRAGTN